MVVQSLKQICHSDVDILLIYNNNNNNNNNNACVTINIFYFSNIKYHIYLFIWICELRAYFYQ